MNKQIFDLGSQPFQSFDMAVKMRDLLSTESPVYYYRIERFESNDKSVGFVIERHDNESNWDTPRLPQNNADIHHDRHQTKPENTDDNERSLIQDLQPKVYRPALRIYLLHLPLILAGCWLLFFTSEVWMTVFSGLGLKSLPAWLHGNSLISGTRLIVGLSMLWLLSRILLNYFGTALRVDHRGITLKKGIISRDETNVRFDEIRTIGLRQGILDRLLTIGILEFACSGTDDMDIQFVNIPSPAELKAEIEEIIQRYKS